MYLFCVDFSRNNLLIEQIGESSFYSLPVLDRSLIKHQAANFADFNVTKMFLMDTDLNIDLSLFESVGIKDCDIFRELALIDSSESFIAFRNDVYFEIKNSDLIMSFNEKPLILKDKNNVAFLIAGSIGYLKSLCNKNIKMSELFRNTGKSNADYLTVDMHYFKHLDNIKSYKSLLFDILNGKTNYKPPFVAEGVFTSGTIPRGDFSIIPPIYLGEIVQIEGGSVIGPNTVIYDNTLISENTSIKNSILFENVFVSSGCFVDGAVCCDNVSVKRNSAVFSGSVIGNNALIGEEMTVENDSVINKNVRYDKFNIQPFKSNKIRLFNSKLQGLTPDKASMLGSATAIVFKGPKILVGCDGSVSALSLKLAFMSGLIASGSECLDVGVTFKAQMFFSSTFCDCDYSVYFSGAGGTAIELFNSNNDALTLTQLCNLFDFCNSGDLVYKGTDKSKGVRQIKGLRRMYIREITAFSDSDLPFVSKIICDNSVLLKTVEEILKICTVQMSGDDGFIIQLNETGTNVNIKFKERVFSQRELRRLVFFFTQKQKNISFFESDLYKKLWRYDSVFLIMAVLNILKYSGDCLDNLLKNIPDFYIKNDTLDLKSKDCQLAEKISSKFRYNHRNGTFNIKADDGFVKVINDKENDKIKVIASSEKMAVSEELCRVFRELLPGL